MDIQEIGELILAWLFVIYAKIAEALLYIILIPCAMGIILYRRLAWQKFH